MKLIPRGFEGGRNISNLSDDDHSSLQVRNCVPGSSLTYEGIDMIGWHEKIACMEQKMDDVTELYRNNMYERIKLGSCSGEGSVLFSEMLTDFERIGDHALNISNEMLKITMIEN